MRIIGSIWICLFICIVCHTTQPSFMSEYIKQYRNDHWMRPSDSLYYIPTVMNLTQSHVFHNMRIEDRRKNLFKILSAERMWLCYPTAIDTVRGTIYANPQGDLDFWFKTRQKITLVPINPVYMGNELIAIAQFIKLYKPDYFFSIDGITGIDESVYWALRNDTLRVLIYNIKDGSLSEHSVDGFLYTEAPDYMFSGNLRLDIINVY